MHILWFLLYFIIWNAFCSAYPCHSPSVFISKFLGGDRGPSCQLKWPTSASCKRNWIAKRYQCFKVPTVNLLGKILPLYIEQVEHASAITAREAKRVTFKSRLCMKSFLACILNPSSLYANTCHGLSFVCSKSDLSVLSSPLSFCL